MRRPQARHTPGAAWGLSFPVDLEGGLSKLAPALVRMGRLHRAIRARAARATHRRVAPDSMQRRVTGEALEAAVARYRAGETLRAIATDVGLSRHGPAALLRERGVRIQRATPSAAEVRDMVQRYANGESLERVGERQGFSAGTVRNHLIAAGVALRDRQGRDR